MLLAHLILTKHISQPYLEDFVGSFGAIQDRSFVATKFFKRFRVEKLLQKSLQLLVLLKGSSSALDTVNAIVERRHDWKWIMRMRLTRSWRLRLTMSELSTSSAIIFSRSIETQWNETLKFQFRVKLFDIIWFDSLKNRSPAFIVPRFSEWETRLK